MSFKSSYLFFLVQNPKILMQFPVVEEELEFSKSVSSFCFPGWPNDLNTSIEHHIYYSFALQAGDGTRKYGFCHRVASSQHSKGPPECLCSILKYPFPLPGEAFVIRSPSGSNYFEGECELIRPVDDFTSINDTNLNPLFDHFDTQHILTLFGCLLEEKRIIFSGSSLSNVSSCCNAVLSFLYPLKWQHVFVPILPVKLIDYVCAPMPYILGIHSSMLQKVLKMPIEEVVILDLDKRELRHADIVTKLPYESVLLSEMNEARTEEGIDNEYLFETFLNFFVKLFGTYRKFMNREDKKMVFLEEDFLKSHKDKDVQNILKKMFECQHYREFIDERIQLYIDEVFPTSPFEIKCSDVLPVAYGLPPKSNFESKFNFLKTKNIRKNLNKTKKKLMNKVKMKDTFTSRDIHVQSSTEFEELFETKITPFKQELTQEDLENMATNEQNLIEIFSKNFDKMHLSLYKNQIGQKKRRSVASLPSKENLLIFFEEAKQEENVIEEVKTTTPMILIDPTKEQVEKQPETMKKVDSNLSIDFLFQDGNNSSNGNSFDSKKGRRGSHFFDNSTTEMKPQPESQINNNPTAKNDLMIDFFSNENSTSSSMTQSKPMNNSSGRQSPMIYQNQFPPQNQQSNEFNSQYTLPTMVLQQSSTSKAPPSTVEQNSFNKNHKIQNQPKNEDKKDPFSDLMW
eukprot:gene5872-9700_t